MRKRKQINLYLEPEENSELETSAIINGVRPSVLARNRYRDGKKEHETATRLAAVQLRVEAIFDLLEAVIRDLGFHSGAFRDALADKPERELSALKWEKKYRDLIESTRRLMEGDKNEA